MTATTEAKRKTEPRTVYFAGGEPLIRAIQNGLLFCSTDPTRPMCNAIRFEFDDGGMRTVSTDTYRLCAENVELDAQIDHTEASAFHFLLDRHVCKDLLATLKMNKTEKFTLTYTGDVARPSVEFRFPGTSRSCDTLDASFPPWRHLIPDKDGTVGTDAIAFNAAFLADLGKVKCRDKLASVDVRLYGPGKPTRIDYREGPLVLLMPYKTVQ